MKKTTLLPALAALAALSIGAPALADDDVAYHAIAAQKWDVAERELLAGLEKNPQNIFRQLNLAWVYSQTGRKEEAAAIYQRILMTDRDRVAALPSGDPASVKSLAERGLQLLDR
jgi:hypothetical protein